MKTIEALELEESDFIVRAILTPEALRAVSDAEIVFYRGELVKNRNGQITRMLANVRHNNA